jgi:hypothetical protein
LYNASVGVVNAAIVRLAPVKKNPQFHPFEYFSKILKNTYVQIQILQIQIRHIGGKTPLLASVTRRFVNKRPVLSKYIIIAKMEP